MSYHTRQKALTDAELAKIVENLDNSEDEFEDFSDSDSIADPDYVPEEENNASISIQETIEDELSDVDLDEPSTSYSSTIPKKSKKQKASRGIKNTYRLMKTRLNSKVIASFHVMFWIWKRHMIFLNTFFLTI